MSREHLAAAELAHEAEKAAPARFLAVHALELAVKAALAGATGAVPRTHNVGGEFGRLFRDRVGSDVSRRINRLLAAYDSSRYPGPEPIEPDELAGDIGFIKEVVTTVIPRLVVETR